MSEFWHVMAWPFLACVILSWMHSFLGIHVIERRIIFVDLALAQTAALGTGCALLLGIGMESAAAYFLALAFTLLGAALLAVCRSQKESVPQEAVIGVFYVVAAALLIIVLSFSGEGDQHIRQALAGNILLVDHWEVIKIFVIYSGIGIFHVLFWKPFYVGSCQRSGAHPHQSRLRRWDFLFYASFGVVVTSSVKIAGVLLVFSFLVIPAVMGTLLSSRFLGRLLWGGTLGTMAAVLGMAGSYLWNLPTAASIICALGGMFVLVVALKRVLSDLGR